VDAEDLGGGAGEVEGPRARPAFWGVGRARALFIPDSGILTFSFFAGLVVGCAATLLGLHWAGVLAL